MRLVGALEHRWWATYGTRGSFTVATLYWWKAFLPQQLFTIFTSVGRLWLLAFGVLLYAGSPPWWMLEGSTCNGLICVIIASIVLKWQWPCLSSGQYSIRGLLLVPWPGNQLRGFLFKGVAVSVNDVSSGSCLDYLMQYIWLRYIHSMVSSFFILAELYKVTVPSLIQKPQVWIALKPEAFMQW